MLEVRLYQVAVPESKLLYWTPPTQQERGSQWRLLFGRRMQQRVQIYRYLGRFANEYSVFIFAEHTDCTSELLYVYKELSVSTWESFGYLRTFCNC